MAFFNPHLRTALNRIILNRVKILHVYTSLREKCPDAEFFLVRIFPHLDWIRRDTIWTHLTQCLLILTNSPRNLQDIMFSKDFASRFYNLHNFIQQSLNSVLRRFMSCSRGVGNLRRWESLTMIIVIRTIIWNLQKIVNRKFWQDHFLIFSTVICRSTSNRIEKFYDKKSVSKERKGA